MNRILTIPNTHKKVPKEFFAGADMEEILFHPKVEVVQQNAFENCKNLKSVIFLGKTYLGENVFAGCVNLKKIGFPEMNFSEARDYLNYFSLDYIPSLTTMYFKDEVVQIVHIGDHPFRLISTEKKDCRTLLHTCKDLLGEKTVKIAEKRKFILLPEGMELDDLFDVYI